MAREATEGSWHPSDDDDYEALNAELKRLFGEWADAHGVEVDHDAPELALHYKWGYLDGHLTRWKRADLSELYLELFPRKVILEDDEVDQVMQEAKTFVRFLSTTGLLAEGSDPADELVEHLGAIDDEFKEHMADSSRHGMAKRFMTKAAAEGVGPTDQAALEGFISRFNARSPTEREAVLGTPALRSSRRATSGRVTPPGTRPRPSSRSRRKRRR